MEGGQPQEAARLLTAALGGLSSDAEDDRERFLLQARVLITLAHAEFELRGLAPANGRLDQAARLASDHDLTEVDVPLRNQRGVLLLRAGRYADAVAAFDESEQFWSAATALDRCRVMLNRAVALIEQNRLPPARADLTSCMKLAESAGLRFLQVKATHNLGYVEFMAGNLPRALRLMDAAHDLDPAISPGVAMLGKAQILVEAGLYREADE